MKNPAITQMLSYNANKSNRIGTRTQRRHRNVRYNREQWTKGINKETKGKTPEDFVIEREGGINVQPIYTKDDIEGYVWCLFLLVVC